MSRSSGIASQTIVWLTSITQLYVVEIHLITLGIIDILDETEDRNILVCLVFYILWLNELRTNIGVLLIKPVVLSSLVQQIKVFTRRIHFAPTHTADI